MSGRCAAEPDTERDWLCGIQARNRAALEQVYRQYSGRICHFLALIDPRQSPEDACLDVFAQLWHSAVTNPPRHGLAEWLFCRAIGLLRQRAVLDLEQRLAVVLVYGTRLPLQSICRVTGMGVAEIAGHLTAARKSHFDVDCGAG